MVRAVVLLLVAYVVISAGVVAWSLFRANAQASQLQRALSTSSSSAVRDSTASLQRDFFWAHLATRGPVWWLASKVPFVGDDVQALRTVAGVGDTVTHVPVAGLLDDSRLQQRLLPKKGRFDLSAIASLTTPVRQTSSQLEGAASQTRKVDPAGLAGPIRRRFQAFTSRVRGAEQAAGAAARAVRVLPTMLGKDRPRTYLLVFDNNAELRATGGMPGAFAVMRADRGRITMERQGVPDDVARLGRFPEPVLPQTSAEESIYSTQLAQYFQDTNFTPEFPRTAALMREMWQRYAGQRLDGVWSVDAITLGYLLRATGPIKAPGGVTLTANNAANELINGVYFRVKEDSQQNAFFTQVARLVFERLVTGVKSAPALLAALGQGVREGRVYVNDFTPKVQSALTGSQVAGEIDLGGSRHPGVGVYLNDATGSKMSFYLRTSASLKSTGCSQGVARFQGRAELTYTADSPPVRDLNAFITGPGTYGTPKGQQLVLVRIYGPRGGSVSGFSVAGSPTQVDVVDDRGRPVATTVVLLSRGDTVPVTWKVRSGQGQTGSAQLSVTPGMTSVPARKDVASACAQG